MQKYESILSDFKKLSGLYILGAGVSAGAVPLGNEFWTNALMDYLANSGSYPVEIPNHSELIQGMIKNYFRIYPAPSDYLKPELVLRMPDHFARLYLKHYLSKFCFSRQQIDSYCIFQFFYPSLICNYNHDGLIHSFANRFHRILDMHGVIPNEYGAPHFCNLLDISRELDIVLPNLSDGLLMGVRESFLDSKLVYKLMDVARFSPNFIAIIGYSFAQNGVLYDDSISLKYFLNSRHGYQGNIYVIDPNPDNLRDLIADSIKSNKVFSIPVYWNLLAHVFRNAVKYQGDKKSMSYRYNKILDSYGSNQIFPLVQN